MKRFAAILFSVFFYTSLFGQTGGNNTYEFLNLPVSARVAALGGNMLVARDNDLSLAIINPSLIGDNLHHQFSLNFAEYISDVNYGSVAYSHTFKKVGSFAGALQFINYGRFLEADEAGMTYGNFSGGEYALTLGWGRKLHKNFLLGANLKMIYSQLEKYNSFGLAVDVAGTYFHEKSGFMASLLFKNIGRQLDAYVPGNIEPLPFEIQLGISQRFNKLPLRYSVVYNHIEKWDLTFKDPKTSNVDPVTGDTISPRKVGVFADKLMRHLVLGVEFYPAKRFYISIGYNYQRRHELRTEVKKGIVGFSFGCGINVYKFRISYAWAKYHLKGSPSTITISTNLTELFSKKEKK
ncbi:MAG TPA: type IX secretion system protein PorQ [Bacteroidales bacterium]|nr:type IX secretion system protein PorQ [Bacteroidales bacterium]HNZ41825.1 type IX secretion system protein PorQ [Bacteroidales bacterium]HOH84574.1 type IX secretion system protein PorQ [Bacteroidales bacterium]HPB24599.1 type IX secretion system protein PorQ [Bacteroidales bacterium]HPI29525.1 type IX secretion system protein PorQ [Bacteroidales bacterium]